ncbi:MAG: helicase-related protein [Chloroherpetonaceae bacterium]|nr:helicase-related protein [Chloroherpetonaceae bacterium]
MPRIFDNIETSLLPALKETLKLSERADFCVGYFNLRGWKAIADSIDAMPSARKPLCCVLVGMQRLPQDDLKALFGFAETSIDNATAHRLRKKLAEEFKEQLTIGAPTDEDEAGLRQLAKQLRQKKVAVKLFLRYPLHAKLYLLHRNDFNNPITGFLGSSNLTLSGLKAQGELNIDVLGHDETQKLSKWFEDRWNDKFCLDISDELATIIEQSWAREDLIPPYYIYLKIAYHLSEEARAGLSEFALPVDFQGKLFKFQETAVRIAARYVHKRGGVMLGDVVGLGKTMMATALARILEDDFGFSTLIICPPKLIPMWQSYVETYGLHARIVSIGNVIKELPEVPARFRLVIIDESHNLRNRDSKRYRAIQDYIAQSGSRVILLSATPYNKLYLDLSNQLRLFVDETQDLGIRPEQLIKKHYGGDEAIFQSKTQCAPRTLAAFEKSEEPDDWRELMRLFLIRRTRSFIQQHYAETDRATGRKYLAFADGMRAFFPKREPKTIKFKIDEQYARLYADEVVELINRLNLPRYGLGNYIAPQKKNPPTQDEAKQLADLSRAGKRLMGFCRTNLFKRLESSGYAFLESIKRHLLRNFVFLYAIENDQPLPIGAQDAALLDTRLTDLDADMLFATDENEEDGDAQTLTVASVAKQKMRALAQDLYQQYATAFKARFKWLRASLFVKALKDDLEKDCEELLKLLQLAGEWDSAQDQKLLALASLLKKKHPTEKVLVFSQFADTVSYLERELQRAGIQAIAAVTGNSEDPTTIARRFSPKSNSVAGKVKPDEELRVLIATDVLSEGQNLQDAHIVVNYDLPWAIIRLVQRAGRVDRIGQTSDTILCYTFLPTDGIERIIRLRERVRRRLRENGEIIGSDEAFFEDDHADQRIHDLFTEKSGALDDEDDAEVDLASQALEIWNEATKVNPELQKIIPELPNVVYSTKPHQPTADEPEGVLVYARTAQGNDMLAWLDKNGKVVSESQLAILKMAACAPDTPALSRLENHHRLVEAGVRTMRELEKNVGGQLGKPTGARYRTYERLKRYAETVRGTFFDTDDLRKAIDEIYRFPLRESARDTLNRQLKAGISDETLAELVIALRRENRLCITNENLELQEPTLICSLGLRLNA